MPRAPSIQNWDKIGQILVFLKTEKKVLEIFVNANVIR